jgi:signal transduction histidine kinase/ligand-binding sensor domain-containing protein
MNLKTTSLQRLNLTAIFLSMCFLTGYGQVPDLRIKYFSREDGIFSSYVNHVTQDSTGFIWIGTRTGLYKYDGYGFTGYFNRQEDSTSITGDYITYLYTDTRGRLWVATTLGLCRYDETLDNFINITDFIRYEELVGRRVEKTGEDSHGNIIISSNNYIFRYDETEGRFSPVLSIEGGQVNDFLVDPSDQIWIGCSDNGGLLRYNLDTGEQELEMTAGTGNNALSNSTISRLAMENGRLWIATLGGGINMLEISTGQLTRYPPANDDESMAVNAYIDNENHVWTIDYTGLKILNRQSGTFVGYYPRPNDPLSIKSALSGIFQDKQGNYWLYHTPGGLGISMRMKGFNVMDYWARDFLNTSGSNIVSIQEDAEGNLWLGNAEGGIDVYGWQNGKTIYYRHNEQDVHSLGRSSILCIFRDSRGTMWIGSYSGGLQYFDKPGRRFISYVNDPENPNSIAGNDIRSIAEDSQGNLWLAVHGKGVDKFDRKHNRFIHYNSERNSLSNNWSFQVLINHLDELWVATAWGLNQLEKGENTFHSYYSASDDTTSLTNNEITTIYEDGNNTLWVGTSSGLNRFNPGSKNFTRYVNSGENNYIAGILSDQDNNLWISNLSGLLRFDPVDHEVKTFSSIDGLKSDEYNARSAFKNGQNTLYFGGIKGIDVFDPGKLVFNEMPPVVLIDKFKILNKALTVANSGGKLQKHISRTDKITIHYNDKVITVNYKALNFINPHTNQYAYRLDGLEEEWNYVGTSKEATYTNLDPGRYVFKVIASNNDGAWNTKGTELEIKVLPPWYSTLVFRLLLILFVIGSVIGYTALRTSNLKKQKIHLERSVEEKTRELSEKNNLLSLQANNLNEANKLLLDRQNQLQQQSEELKSQSESLAEANAELQKLNATKDKLFSIIAHDLTSPFNTMMGFTELLISQFDTTDDEKKLNYLKLIQDSSEAAYTLLQNLLLWARSQTNRISYQPQEIRVKGIIDEVVELNRGNLQAKRIGVSVECSEDLKVIADLDMIRTIFRNLLSNAVKFTPQQGSIRFSVEVVKGRVNISVSDTGVGIKKEKIDELLSGGIVTPGQGTEGEYGSGLGLTLCREFIKIHKGQLRISGEKGRGSTFTFSLDRVSG